MMNSREYGPQTDFADQLHAQKYRSDGETFRESMGRVASALKDDARHYGVLREILLDMRFLPAGRVQAAMGSVKNVTAFNCFVSDVIPDSFTERDNPQRSSIMDRARDAAQTMRMGGGIGYDFSTLRPRGDVIAKLQSQSSGPLEFMHIFDAVCKATSSSGNRRGAQMGVLRIDHPDSWEFVHKKQAPGVLEGFNISLAVTDEFMDCLAAERPFPLKFGGRVYREIDPVAMWEAVMRATWDWAEPGVLFIDTINRTNNLWYCETIAATNPCAEQTLPPNGACLLGSFNLTKYLSQQSGAYAFDFDLLEADLPPVVRAMDNVVDRSRYPLEAQSREAWDKRRIGLGVTGLANVGEAMGHPYGTPGFLALQSEIQGRLERGSYLASAQLSREKGSFPLYDEERYMKSPSVKRLDDDVKRAIRRYGMRNSHLTSVAPTGTISMTADNVSSSIEPVYRWKQERYVIMREGRQLTDLYDYGFGALGVRGRRSSRGEVSAAQHVAVLLAAQKHVDSAVSKTVNCDASMPWEDFKGVYLAAYEGGAKGCTTYNKDGKRAGLFRDTDEPDDLPFPTREYESVPAALTAVADGSSCEFDPATGRRSCE